MRSDGQSSGFENRPLALVLHIHFSGSIRKMDPSSSISAFHPLLENLHLHSHPRIPACSEHGSKCRNRSSLDEELALEIEVLVLAGGPEPGGKPELSCTTMVRPNVKADADHAEPVQPSSDLPSKQGLWIRWRSGAAEARRRCQKSGTRERPTWNSRRS